MNMLEAIRDTVDGKWARAIDWPPDWYIYPDEDGKHIVERHSSLSYHTGSYSPTIEDALGEWETIDPFMLQETEIQGEYQFVENP
jgi:hypothetical protein